jgi:hypothetical protein
VNVGSQRGGFVGSLLCRDMVISTPASTILIMRGNGDRVSICYLPAYDVRGGKILLAMGIMK